MTNVVRVAAACALLAACGPKLECEKPEEVVKTFYSSVTFGDTETAFGLLSGADRRALAGRAEEASEVTGRELEGPDMIVPGLVRLQGEIAGAKFEPVRVEVGDVKSVRITFPDGSTVDAPVVREAGCYRVPLGLGPAQPPTGG